MLAPCIVTREFMNQVKERGVDDAHIIFINRLDYGYVLLYTLCYSISGHSVSSQSPFHFYCATKYAITAIAEGVRQELREMKSNCRATVSALHKFWTPFCSQTFFWQCCLTLTFI